MTSMVSSGNRLTSLVVSVPEVLAAAIPLAGLTSLALRVAEASAHSLRICLAEKVNRVGALVVSKAFVSIDFYTAMLGGEVMITLSNGSKVKMKIKPETQPGTKVRLRGKGYDRGDGTFGDLIITYQVKLPTNLTERQKELLREMQRA